MPSFTADAPCAPPPAARIALLQQSFACTLPAVYVAFLRDHNGARLAIPAVRIAGRDMMVDRLLPILADPRNDPMGWADVAVVATQLDARLVTSADRPGVDLIPVAALSGGDFLVLDYRAGQQAEPAMAIWLHETSDDFAPDTHPVATSFAAFIRALP